MLGQPVAKASKTRTASKRERPEPPNSSRAPIAAIPSAAASRRVSMGKYFSLSHSSARGASFSRAKPNAISRIASCSSLNPNVENIAAPASAILGIWGAAAS